MRYGLISQIIMVVVSLVVIFTYIQPKFSELQVLQEQSAQFKAAAENATQFNILLQSILQDIDNFSSADLAKLDVYVPNTIDPVMVSRDIQTIVERTGMQTRSIVIAAPDTAIESNDVARDVFDEADPATISSDGAAPTFTRSSQLFSVTVLGSYEQLERLMRAVEVNAYPLYVRDLSFENAEAGNLFSFNITLETFAIIPQL